MQTLRAWLVSVIVILSITASAYGDTEMVWTIPQLDPICHRIAHDLVDLQPFRPSLVAVAARRCALTPEQVSRLERVRSECEEAWVRDVVESSERWADRMRTSDAPRGGTPEYIEAQMPFNDDFVREMDRHRSAFLERFCGELTDAQRASWTTLDRDLRRGLWLHFFGVSQRECVDLTALVAGLPIDSEAFAAAAGVLGMYEQRLDELLTERDAATESLDDALVAHLTAPRAGPRSGDRFISAGPPQVRLPEGGSTSEAHAANPIRHALRRLEASHKIETLNEETGELLAGVLPPDAARVVRQHVDAHPRQWPAARSSPDIDSNSDVFPCGLSWEFQLLDGIRPDGVIHEGPRPHGSRIVEIIDAEPLTVEQCAALDAIRAECRAAARKPASEGGLYEDDAGPSQIRRRQYFMVTRRCGVSLWLVGERLPVARFERSPLQAQRDEFERRMLEQIRAVLTVRQRALICR